MRLSLFAVAALLASSVAAHADTVYTFNGQNYTNVTGVFTTSESLTGSITLAAPLAANLNELGETPISYTFFDGLETLTKANTEPTGEYFIFSTDASGAITGYLFQLVDSVDVDNQVVFQAQTNSVGVESGIAGTADVYGTPGSFTEQTVAVTPEPSSIALLGTGILGMFGVMKRRFA